MQNPTFYAYNPASANSVAGRFNSANLPRPNLSGLTHWRSIDFLSESWRGGAVQRFTPSKQHSHKRANVLDFQTISCRLCLQEVAWRCQFRFVWGYEACPAAHDSGV